jgi:subtilase family serine protease
MENLHRALGWKRRLIPVFLATLCFFSVAAFTQQPATRIATEIDNSDRVPIKGSKSPMARPENEAGRVPGETKLEGINIFFSRSAEQEADLDALIAAQQDANSPLYHKWLTSEEFGARFGLADSDIATVQSWLEQQGFTVNSVSPSKSHITFSGTIAQIEAAFGAEMHYYNVGGKKHFTPSTDFAIPAALSSVVQAVTNLSSFKPHPHVKFRNPQLAPRPEYTSGQTGNHFLTPKDVATVYDISPAYNAGYTGSGQSIAVVGQSSVVLSDIEHFQTAAGFTVKDPTPILVPNSGTAMVLSGDEAESDLDLEYSSTIGKGATIYFVYTGDNQNYNVWDSIQYAVDHKVAPIISDSYGICETALASSDYSSLNVVLAQAATQGQTVLVPTGDNGSTDCYGETGLTIAQQEALAVDFPASSQYVTAMGGTEFPSADVAASNTTYWQSAIGSDVISSVLSYIPEQVWNDDSAAGGLAAGGGGVSAFTARPSWQTGVTGIPSASHRLVPDISLDASGYNAGYLFCSSDSSATQIAGSCSNGFRDSSNKYLTVAGGTSFDSPIFAGMVAILAQKLNSTGLGVVNSTLYSLAANSTSYASAFHDITSGSNACPSSASYCSSAGASEYLATTGYDEATGLGSIDFYNLLNAWPSFTTPSTTTLSAASSSVAPGANDAIIITVASASSSVTTTPTGTVTVAVDGIAQSPLLGLSSGSATYTFSSTSIGSHTISATYSGDSTFASSSGSVNVTVTASKTFTLSATNVTVYAGNTGTSTVTITPKNGYTGTVTFTVSSSPSLTNGCFSLPNTTVSGSSTVTATLTARTNSSACASGALVGPAVGQQNFVGGALRTLVNDFGLFSAFNKAQAGLALAGLFSVALLVWHFGCHRLGIIAGVFLLVAIGFAISAISGCGGGGGYGSNAAKGTYTVTIVGTDTGSSSITASTTMTLTID